MARGTRGGGQAPARTPRSAMLSERAQRPKKLMGPYEEVVLRAEQRRRLDRLDFLVEVRPIGHKGYHLVARFEAEQDANQYATVLGRRSECPVRRYV